MIHHKLLTMAGIDPEIYSGFAFGIGITRLVAIKYMLHDVRLLTDNDLKFIQSF
jgi:phenylalanyl-tRNA synthetase alpha chain